MSTSKALNFQLEYYIIQWIAEDIFFLLITLIANLYYTINRLCLHLCSRIIWLGDLNYRIALSYRTAKALVEMRNWRALLENDQVNQANQQVSFMKYIQFITLLI